MGSRAFVNKITNFSPLMWPAEELGVKRKKQLKKDTASKMKSLVDEVHIVLLGISWSH